MTLSRLDFFAGCAFGRRQFIDHAGRTDIARIVAEAKELDEKLPREVVHVEEIDK